MRQLLLFFILLLFTSPSVPPSVSWLNWLDTLVDIWLINAANASLSAFLSVEALPVPQIYSLLC